jgi:hypothetical protein
MEGRDEEETHCEGAEQKNGGVGNQWEAWWMAISLTSKSSINSKGI